MSGEQDRIKLSSNFLAWDQKRQTMKKSTHTSLEAKAGSKAAPLLFSSTRKGTL